MRKHLLAGLLFVATPFLFAQGDAARRLPSDPKSLLEMTAPYYDYASSDMKPWHVRYLYRSYDQNGELTTEGQFDYWWSTDKVSRASWTRGNQSLNEWHTADGKVLRSLAGNDVTGMEHRLYFALLPSFWKMSDSSSSDEQLKYFASQSLSKQLACVGSVKASRAAPRADSFESVWPSYCFDEHEPALIASHENGTITTAYGEVQKFQNHNFPRRIEISYVGKKRVEATLDDLDEVRANDVAFTPSADAKEYVQRTNVTVVPVMSMMPLVLIHRVNPVYPPSARGAHISGTVVVSATIGKDGRIKDAKVISSPDSSLSEAALDAVRQWRYQPYTVNGEPMEVHTSISLNFAL